MHEIKKFVQQLYSKGNPILLDDGFWHVEWHPAAGGETHITSFGWKDIERAKAHIKMVMAR